MSTTETSDSSSDAREFTGLSLEEPHPSLAPSVASVLIVEDEHLVALDIQLRLEKMGHHATVSYSGEEALARVAERHFDLVLMDIKLNGQLDGIETARRIRSGYDIPIVYLTAYADNHTLDRARVTEPYGYVLKPFQERELRAAIEMTLQRHSNDRQRWEQQQLQRFLADASAQLASSLDYRAVCIGAADLLIPRYGDWCTLHLKDSSDLIPSFTFTRPEPEERLHEADDSEEAGHLLSIVESTGTSEIMTQVVDAGALKDALGARHLQTLREVGARSLICVPLLARDQVLGSLALVSGRGRPRFSISDLVFAEDFARRLAMALDNALLYRAANRAIRMRDDVLAIVSHDLRTPLGTISMQAETLVGDDRVSKAAISIIRAAQRMNRLIGDLLDASAINAGGLALDLRSHDAGDVVREATEMFRSHAEARQIKLLEQFPGEPMLVVCDRDRIVQVLSNLLGNAIKFTPRGGTVTLRVESKASRVVFSVSDTGHGIGNDQLPHLFERFWRGHPHGNGAGLGLFIARGIVAAHGGSLGVDTMPGAGSRFYFDIAEHGR
ncbi:MAG TPA: ATP-binding protein [Kofleriaceae bacterium]|jgi:signal transduction histidine kinase/CheY-like chemotaxis protein|nr:ATP-binding protein [Kofleriaceae bacterium]